MNNYLNWESNDVVSIWVGSFSSRDAFELFFREKISDDETDKTPMNKFAEAIGVTFYDHDLQETEFFGENQMPIKELLSPFSNSSSFIDLAVATADEKLIKAANTAILLFDCNFTGQTNLNSPIKFVGSFPYKKTALPFSEI